MGGLGKHPIPFLPVIVCGFLCFPMLQLSLLLFAKHLWVNRKNLYHQQNAKMFTLKTSHHIVVYVVKVNIFSVAAQLADVSWMLINFFFSLHVWLWEFDVSILWKASQTTGLTILVPDTDCSSSSKTALCHYASLPWNAPPVCLL